MDCVHLHKALMGVTASLVHLDRLLVGTNRSLLVPGLLAKIWCIPQHQTSPGFLGAPGVGGGGAEPSG